MSPESIGERLRRSRQRTGATILQASHATKIRPDFIHSMEQDSFSFVSGKAYVRGLLLAYVRWLRLDAAEFAAEFDAVYGRPKAPSLAEIARQPARAAPKPPRNGWVVASALALGLLLVLSLAGILRAPGDDVAAPPPLPGAPATTPPGSPSVLAEAPRTAPEGPAPAHSGVNLVVSAVDDRSWIRVEVDDGSRPFQGIVAAGESKTFEGERAVRVTFGNLPAVRVRINGRDLGQLGAPGQTVGTITFTPDSVPAVAG